MNVVRVTMSVVRVTVNVVRVTVNVVRVTVNVVRKIVRVNPLTSSPEQTICTDGADQFFHLEHI